MIQLADLFDPKPNNVWFLDRQLGVTKAVTLLEQGEQMIRWPKDGLSIYDPTSIDAHRWEREKPWSLASLSRLKASFEEAGLDLVAIEDTPPLDKVRLGLPGKEEQIEWVCEQIEAMGKLGINILCYNWMALISWSRTNVAIPERGGALVTGFYRSALPAYVEQMDKWKHIDPETLWLNLEYFLGKVIPVAERAGVKLAMHPDDPPINSFLGIPRIMTSIEAFDQLIAMYDSPVNGITFCQGNFVLFSDNITAAIKRYGSKKKIVYVHFRDVAGTRENFRETFHDNGPTNMLACLRAYEEVGFDGIMRPDHVPTLYGEPNSRPGYEVLGRLFAFGYIKGLMEGIGYSFKA